MGSRDSKDCCPLGTSTPRRHWRYKRIGYQTDINDGNGEAHQSTMPDYNTNFVFSYLRDVYGLQGEDINALDAEAFIEKVKRTHQGLSAEHEFAAIATWLGKCSLITQLDNVLHSSDQYRVPDFL